MNALIPYSLKRNALNAPDDQKYNIGDDRGTHDNPSVDSKTWVTSGVEDAKEEEADGHLDKSDTRNEGKSC